MKEYMPGHNGWVDRGPRKLNSFDKERGWRWSTPQDTRSMGADGGWDDTTGEFYYDSRPIGYNRPARFEPYLSALSDFMAHYINRMEPKKRQDLDAVKAHLYSIMYDGRSLRTIAAEKGQDHTALVHARKRALAQLVEATGGVEGFARELVFFMKMNGVNPGYLPEFVRIAAEKEAKNG